MWKSLLLVGVSILPLRAESACTGKDLQGRYVGLVAGLATGELPAGFWFSCNFRVKASGLATGSCLLPTGATVPIDPVRFSVRPNCSVSGTSVSGISSYSLRMQPHKRGLIGRFRVDDGVNVLEGPVVAVKRGK
jgi:hypothetical protein